MPTNLAVSPRWRAVRGWLFAGVATLLAAAGHQVGGGMAPDPAALITVAALIGTVVTTLSGKQLRFPAVLGLLAAAELLFHVMFALTEHVPHPVDAPRMLVFHALAGLLTAAVLAGGERALFALLRRLPWPRAFSPVRLAVAVPIALVATATRVTLPPPAPVLAACPHRGPPPD